MERLKIPLPEAFHFLKNFGEGAALHELSSVSRRLTLLRGEGARYDLVVAPLEDVSAEGDECMSWRINRKMPMKRMDPPTIPT